MNPTEIEFAVRDLVAKPYDPATFPFDLIGILNTSKVTVSRLKSGQTNAAKQPGDVLWRKHLFFRAAGIGDDVGVIGDALAADPLTVKHKPRFILVTNGDQVHARDMELDDTLNVVYAQLDESSDFLLPLAGYERRAVVEEHPADIKAAKKLKKLYDAILTANPTWSTGHHTHELNLLMTRLLFCFYAEKTGIFATPKIFTNTLTQYTTENGSDVAPLLDRLFRIMNLEDKERPKNTTAVEAKFPYVNGSLFEDTVQIPQFNRTARRQMLECGDLDWTTINPDIFGSMIQTIVEPGSRSDYGLHYTSRPNIMKVLQPLFLDDLHDAYGKAKGSVPKLEALLGRLSRIRVFDPACGSGNFLVNAYKEMRRLEIDILKHIGEIAPRAPFRLSSISLQHFYGIDIVDFACETAKLSLWIGEHQMNVTFKEIFGAANATLPLAKITTVRNGNAIREDWLDFCPPRNSLEIYICGNPPYQGSVGQDQSQKDDITLIFSPILKAYRDVDYVSCWFVKLADYISNSGDVRGALVSTNSVCQGEQVPFLWPYVLDRDIRIMFAHTSFKWSNSASHNAGVTCVIVGLCRTDDHHKKTLYHDNHAQIVSYINPYLTPGETPIVLKAQNPLFQLPPIAKGNLPNDGGHLILLPAEKDEILDKYPTAAGLIRRYIGSSEFIHGTDRYCLWISDTNLPIAQSIPPIRDRILAVLRTRQKGGTQARAAVNVPHRFVYISHRDAEAIIIPEVSSEHRQYLQIGLIGKSDVPNNKLYVCYDPPSYLLATLSSRMHRLWLLTVGGGLETRPSYSNTLVYNTFPIPALSSEQRQVLSEHSMAILKARAKHLGKTIAWLYDPATMPANLAKAHEDNDGYLEQYVYGRAFKDDTQRLEHLFAMYARLIQAKKQESRLFDERPEKRAV